MEILGLSPSTPKPTSRIRELFWPKIEDEVAATTAARNAMYACLLIAILTGVAGLITQNAWVALDVLLFAIAGIGVRQLSRAAALTAFAMYALAWFGVGGFSILRPLVLVILLGGVRAAAFAHHMKKDVREAIANPAMDTSSMSRIGIVLEELPRRVWPAIHGPFLAVLGLLVALNLMALNSILFGRLYQTPTPSMEPTIAVGDRVFVAYPLFSGTLRRGDVIAVLYPVDRKEIFLKRIVGVPGDRIRLLNKDLWINGVQAREPYVQHFTTFVDPYRDNFPAAEPTVMVAQQAAVMLSQNVRNKEVVVPAGRYFVLGDNRDNSLDRRYWGFAEDADIVGRPVFLLGKGRSNFLRYPL